MHMHTQHRLQLMHAHTNMHREQIGKLCVCVCVCVCVYMCVCVCLCLWVYAYSCMHARVVVYGLKIRIQEPPMHKCGTVPVSGTKFLPNKILRGVRTPAFFIRTDSAPPRI
jgi:hypothetical protein